MRSPDCTDTDSGNSSDDDGSEVEAMKVLLLRLRVEREELQARANAELAEKHTADAISRPDGDGNRMEKGKAMMKKPKKKVPFRRKGESKATRPDKSHPPPPSMKGKLQKEGQRDPAEAKEEGTVIAEGTVIEVVSRLAGKSTELRSRIEGQYADLYEVLARQIKDGKELKKKLGLMTTALKKMEITVEGLVAEVKDLEEWRQEMEKDESMEE